MATRHVARGDRVIIIARRGHIERYHGMRIDSFIARHPEVKRRSSLGYEMCSVEAINFVHRRAHQDSHPRRWLTGPNG